MSERRAEPGDRHEALRVTVRVAVLAIALNVVLVVTKYGLGVLSGSVALRADAVHSLADVFASASVLAGLYLARRRTAQFPYGLYKVENLVALLSAAFVFAAAYELGREAISHALTAEGEQSLANVPATLAGVAGIAILSFGFGRYERSIARRTGSPALEADAGHIYADTLTSVAVIVSLLASLKGVYLDWIATLVIVAFIARTGWQITVGAIRVLLDASVERDVLNAVEGVIMEQSEVAEVTNLRGRNSGSFRFIEAAVTLNVHDLETAHQVGRRVEAAVREAATNVDSVLIHYEPVQKDTYVYAFPTDDARTISPHFGEARQLLLVTVGTADKLVAEVELLDNPFTELEHGKGIRVAEMLVERGADAVFVRERLRGRGPQYVFGEARARLSVAEAESIEAALAADGVDVSRGMLPRAR